MATFTHRYPLNVPGKYYIDMQCTDCDLCRQIAPKNIDRDHRTGYSFVFKQPATPDEIFLLQECVEGCPTDGVGNDGDEFNWESTPIYNWNKKYARERGFQFDLRAPLLPETK
jgi:ferredoxin